jgi:FixJ family two-component response regulator
MDSQRSIVCVSPSYAVSGRMHRFAETHETHVHHFPTLAESLDRITPLQQTVFVLCDPDHGARAEAEFKALRKRGFPQPVLIAVRRVHLPAVISAMRSGVFAVVQFESIADGPEGQLVDPGPLDDLLEDALVAAADAVAAAQYRQDVHAHLQALADGELEVLRGMLEGKLNKRVANELGISERTVEARRRRIFDKMETRSVARLSRMIVESIGFQGFLRLCEALPRRIPAPHFMPGGASSVKPTSDVGVAEGNRADEDRPTR